MIESVCALWISRVGAERKSSHVTEFARLVVTQLVVVHTSNCNCSIVKIGEQDI